MDDKYEQTNYAFGGIVGMRKSSKKYNPEPNKKTDLPRGVPIKVEGKSYFIIKKKERILKHFTRGHSIIWS